jgi:hypothetical protein
MSQPVNVLFPLTRRIPAIWLAVLFLLIMPLAAGADDPPLVDTIHLKNGGVLYGSVEEITENKQRFYLVRTEGGMTLKLKRSQVSHVQEPTDAMREYLQLKQSMADSVDAHWQMQQWCLDNSRRDSRLARQREYHLLKIIELDPDHKDARARLGHKDIDGVWVHWDHFMLNQGYVKDGRGVQRLPQAIDMHERAEAAEQIVADWNRRLKTLITKITRRSDGDALRELQQIKDPAAVPGLMNVYQEKNQHRRLKETVIDLLGQIEAAPAQNALVVIATTDADLDLAERAVNRLQQPHFDRDGIVRTVLHWLRPSAGTTVAANDLVNRAAWLIGRLKYTEATRELIDALVTVHRVPTGAPGGNINVGQGAGGQGLQMGNQPQFAERAFRNQAVLDTLRLTTPVDFDFNEKAWMNWYIRQNTISTSHVGRDQ